MKKTLFLILFVAITFLISDNVYASNCKYNEGGIACCKKYGKVQVSEGTTVEPICRVEGSGVTADWNECYQDNVNVTNRVFDNGKKPTNSAICESLGTAYYGNFNYKVTDCKWSKNGCYCKVYEKKIDSVNCFEWSCPKGSKYAGGTTSRGQKPICTATKTTLVDGCVEYEEQESERVCPAYINWEVKAEGQCYSKLGSYSDSYDWDSCVYTDETMKEEAYGDSVYCPVYCLETFSTDVANYTQLVKAGTNFVFPSKDNYLEGSRWCTTKYINYDKFLSDLKYATQQIVTYYIQWKYEELKEEIIDEFEPSDTPNCDKVCDYNDGERCCKVYGQVRSTCDILDDEGNVVDTETCWIPGCEEPDPVGPYYHGHKWGYKDTGKGHSELLYVDGKVSGNVSVTVWCDSDDGEPVDPPTADPEKYKKLYEEWLSKAKSIYNRMKNCYDWGDFSLEEKKKEFYNVSPEVEITYKGDNGNQYIYEGDLNVSTSIDITKDIEECEPTTVELITGYDSNKYRIVETFPIKKCTNREVQANSYSTLSLNDGVYRYVDKSNGQSFHKNELSSFGNSKYFNYIDIGYGNLPVGFATKPGVYGYSTQVGELSLTYYNIGHIDKNGNSKIEKVIESEAQKEGKQDYNKIYCDYEITNGIVPDKFEPSKPNEASGVTLIYRPIDLYDPFPGIDGNGRDTGTNWCDSNSCNNKNSTVEKYILNNRDVIGDNVYTLEPMYSFTLTPTIINQIREYNKDNAYDYYDYDDGTKTGLVCDKGTGEHCISDYLTKLIDMTNATGVCTKNRKETFDTCRY